MPIFDWLRNSDIWLNDYLLPLGWKLLGVVVLWIVGNSFIKLCHRLLEARMQASTIDGTLTHYMKSGVQISLRIMLIIAILSVLGIETTSLAALVAAIGIAIGAAWAGLLSNFAAGVFLIILRPFAIGHSICAAGISGIVREIGLFITIVDTFDNVRTYIGNSKLFTDNIINYSCNDYRRIDIKYTLPHELSLSEVCAQIEQQLRQIENVLTQPNIEIEPVGINANSIILAIRPYAKTAHYWQVYVDSLKAMATLAAQHHWPIPATRTIVENDNKGRA